MKFLIVDDDPAILDLLTVILIGHGYENVVRAESAVQALQILHVHGTPFDCLIFDIQMPEMDGIDLTRAVRGFPSYADTPILMLTAMRDEDHISRAFSAGATDYTVKPFDVFHLMDRIRVAELLTENEGSSTAEAEPLEFDDCLLSRTALENFTRICTEQRHLHPAAITVHVPADVGAVPAEVAAIIAETLYQAKVFSTYLGDGRYLSVCDRMSVLEADVLEVELRDRLQDYAAPALGADGVVVHTGRWTFPRAYERASDMSFLDRAIAAEPRSTARSGHGEKASLIKRILRPGQSKLRHLVPQKRGRNDSTHYSGAKS